MICPNCNRILVDETTICPNCNAIISGGTPIVNQNPTKLDSKGRPKMIFNIVFAVWLMITYASTGVSALNIFSAENIWQFLIMLIPIIIDVAVIATGILLINRHKLGFIFQYIINAIGLLGNIAMFGLAMYIIFLFDGSGSELDMALNFIVDFFAWVFAILALPNIGMHTAGLIYYTKNKEKYFCEENTVAEINQESVNSRLN